MPNPIADPLVEAVDTDAESPLVRIEATRAGAATVWIETFGAGGLDSLSVGALHEALETLKGAKGVRIVFFRGRSGGRLGAEDAEALRLSEVLNEDDHRADAQALARMLKEIADLPALTVALVEGTAVGAGGAITAACDMAVAVADAQFGFPDVRRGLVLAVAAPFLIEAVGPRAARNLLAFGRTIDAAQAAQIGLVHQVVADAAALDALQGDLAAEVMACAPGALAQAKAVVHHLAGRRIDHGMIDELARRQAQSRMGEESKAGVAAVLEGRPAPWRAI